MFRRNPDIDIEALAHELAKTVRDFEHYFETIDHPKLETWLEDTLREKLK